MIHLRNCGPPDDPSARIQFIVNDTGLELHCTGIAIDDLTKRAAHPNCAAQLNDVFLHGLARATFHHNSRRYVVFGLTT